MGDLGGSEIWRILIWAIAVIALGWIEPGGRESYTFCGGRIFLAYSLTGG